MNPLIISNPLATSTVVYLKPNQSLELIFHSFYGLKEVVSKSDFLDENVFMLENQATVHQFKHSTAIINWSHISQTFLGEIKIFRDNTTCCTIGVVLDSEFAHTLTVIEPEGCEVRLRPNQLLEIILLNCSASDKVFATATIGSCNLRYQQIDYKENGKYRTFPVPFRSCLFELSNIIDMWPAGTYSAGSVIFTVWKEGRTSCERYAVFVNLKIKRKDKHHSIQQGYQDINLTPKLFTSMEEDCKILEVGQNGNRVRKIQDIN